MTLSRGPGGPGADAHWRLGQPAHQLWFGPLRRLVRSVCDSSALIFATVFYQSLFSGESVEITTQQARATVRQVGDPTYLAYCV